MVSSTMSRAAVLALLLAAASAGLAAAADRSQEAGPVVIVPQGSLSQGGSCSAPTHQSCCAAAGLLRPATTCCPKGVAVAPCCAPCCVQCVTFKSKGSRRRRRGTRRRRANRRRRRNARRRRRGRKSGGCKGKRRRRRGGCRRRNKRRRGGRRRRRRRGGLAGGLKIMKIITMPTPPATPAPPPAAARPCPCLSCPCPAAARVAAVKAFMAKKKALRKAKKAARKKAKELAAVAQKVKVEVAKQAVGVAAQAKQLEKADEKLHKPGKKMNALKRKLKNARTVRRASRVVRNMKRLVRRDKRRWRRHRHLRRAIKRKLAAKLKGKVPLPKRRHRGALKQAQRALSVRIHFKNGYQHFKVFEFGAAAPGNAKANPAGFRSEWENFPLAFAKVWRAYKSEPRAVRKAHRWQFWIAGHASKNGDAARNRRLSKRRARSVACYLAHYLPNKGVRKFTLHIGYFGESQARGNSPVDQAKDRHVEVFMSSSPSVARFKASKKHGRWTESSVSLKQKCGVPGSWRAAGFHNSWLTKLAKRGRRKRRAAVPKPAPAPAPQPQPQPPKDKPWLQVALGAVKDFAQSDRGKAARAKIKAAGLDIVKRKDFQDDGKKLLKKLTGLNV